MDIRSSPFRDAAKILDRMHFLLGYHAGELCQALLFHGVTPFDRVFLKLIALGLTPDEYSVFKEPAPKRPPICPVKKYFHLQIQAEFR